MEHIPHVVILFLLSLIALLQLTRFFPVISGAVLDIGQITRSLIIYEPRSLGRSVPIIWTEKSHHIQISRITKADNIMHTTSLYGLLPMV